LSDNEEKKNADKQHLSFWNKIRQKRVDE